MWKDFFYYTKSERRAIYVLMILIALLLTAIILLPDHRVKLYSDSLEVDSMELSNFLAGVKKIEKKKSTGYLNYRKDSVAFRLKPFDPNIVDSIELLDMGLPAYIVRNVMKYRQKGGRFLTIESFSKIYGLKPYQFEAIKPYIYITEVVSIKNESVVEVDSLRHMSDSLPFTKVFKYPKGTLVDVGSADTLELKKIPGIGSVIARRIVAYRHRLGGFYDLAQLEELDYITPEMMKWFKLDSIQIKKIAINRTGLDKLRSHPYINFYQAKAIVEYRKKQGKIISLSHLRLFDEFNERDLERLSHYFKFD